MHFFFSTGFFGIFSCQPFSFFFESKSHARREKDTLYRARARSGDRTISTVVMSGGVTRRAQERQTKGVRDVWDVIVKWDDICFQHIIPRLNSNDVKFLYEVNTETRKLIKRSSRKKELKKKFIVREMSSLSTLEVAWENKSLWPSWWEDETWFCVKVAHTNKLELLKWAREEKKCKWNG